MRAFIAIELPDQVRRQLGEQIAALRAKLDDRVVRWSRADSTHLTVRFLGEIDDSQLRQATDAIDQAASELSPFEFQVADELGCFPSWQRPRVFWIGLTDDGGELALLNQAIERELRQREFEAERRPFHPHLTIGRAQRAASRKELAGLAQVLQEMPLVSPGRVSVDHISLMQSDLRPSGAVHTQVYSAELEARRP